MEPYLAIFAFVNLTFIIVVWPHAFALVLFGWNAQLDRAQASETVAQAQENLKSIVAFVVPAKWLLLVEEQVVEMDSVPNHLGLLLRGHVGVRKVEIVRVNHGAQRNAETHETRVAGLLLNDGDVAGLALLLGDEEVRVDAQVHAATEARGALDDAHGSFIALSVPRHHLDRWRAAPTPDRHKRACERCGTLFICVHV